jgi:hypothetical protein
MQEARRGGENLRSGGIRGGCNNQSIRGGVCNKHGAKLILATSMGKGKTSLRAMEGCKAKVEVDIDAHGMKIDACRE